MSRNWSFKKTEQSVFISNGVKTIGLLYVGHTKEAEFITEAGNVLNETGFSPAELRDQVEELLEMLNDYQKTTASTICSFDEGTLGYRELLPS